MLAALLAWVEAYYTRDDTCSLAAHRQLYDSYFGKKTEITWLGEREHTNDTTAAVPTE
jgi:hypothetical protein